MDELTMLVRLAGGENETICRLRDAGYRRAKDIARADASDLRNAAGLSEAASRRLLRAAQERLDVPDERRARAPRRGLAAVPEAEAPARARVGSRTVAARVPASRSAAPEPAAATESAAGANRGVTREESSALAGEAPREERITQSFWRFG